MFHLLKKPIYTDWVFYLWILSVIAIIPGTLLSPMNGGGLGSFFIGFVSAPRVLGSLLLIQVRALVFPQTS